MYTLSRGALVLAISKGSGSFELPQTLRVDSHSSKRKSSDSSSPSRSARQRFPSLPGNYDLNLSATFTIQPPVLSPRKQPKNKKKKRKRLRRANTAAPFDNKVLRDRRSNPDFKRPETQRSGGNCASADTSISIAASATYSYRSTTQMSSDGFNKPRKVKRNTRRCSIVTCQDPILLRAISQPLQTSADSNTPKLQSLSTAETHSEGGCTYSVCNFTVLF